LAFTYGFYIEYPDSNEAMVGAFTSEDLYSDDNEFILKVAMRKREEGLTDRERQEIIELIECVPELRECYLWRFCQERET